jgi:hypothetical protein
VNTGGCRTVRHLALDERSPGFLTRTNNPCLGSRRRALPSYDERRRTASTLCPRSSKGRAPASYSGGSGSIPDVGSDTPCLVAHAARLVEHPLCTREDPVRLRTWALTVPTEETLHAPIWGCAPTTRSGSWFDSSRADRGHRPLPIGSWPSLGRSSSRRPIGAVSSLGRSSPPLSILRRVSGELVQFTLHPAHSQRRSTNDDAPYRSQAHGRRAARALPRSRHPAAGDASGLLKTRQPFATRPLSLPSSSGQDLRLSSGRCRFDSGREYHLESRRETSSSGIDVMIFETHGDVTRLVTRAVCDSAEAGAIPVRHPERADLAPRERPRRPVEGRRSPKPVRRRFDSCRGRFVLVAERLGVGLLNRQKQVRLLPGTRTTASVFRDSTCNSDALFMYLRPVMRLASQFRCLRNEAGSIPARGAPLSSGS